MAYMSQEKKKAIAPKVKAICTKYGVKGSLSVNNYSTLVLNIRSGDIDFIANYYKDNEYYNEYYRLATDHIQVNPYHFERHFAGVAHDFLKEVYDAMMDGNHDNSDIMTDYFDVGWYININIGKWDKPYILTAEPEAVVTVKDKDNDIDIVVKRLINTDLEASGLLYDLHEIVKEVSDTCGHSSNWNGKTQEFLQKIENILENE